MPANNDPIFSRLGDVSNNGTTGFASALTAAANDFSGIGVNNVLVFTADAANGGFIQRLRFKALGTNVATVARIFLNNGTDNTVAANNVFYGEIALPATTVSAVAQTGPDIDYALNIPLPPNFRVYVGVATTVAAGWDVTAIGGKY